MKPGKQPGAVVWYRTHAGWAQAQVDAVHGSGPNPELLLRAGRQGLLVFTERASWVFTRRPRRRSAR